MPRKRAAREARETPEQRYWRELRIEELEATLTRLGPVDEKKAAKADARFDRDWAAGREIWDRLSTVAREHEAAQVLADLRRYDKKATLGADGGREVFALHYAVDREIARWEKQKAKHPTPTLTFAPVRGEGVARPALRPADATEAVQATDQPTPPRKRRRPRPAGHAGYIDLQRFDADDWED